MECFGSGSLSIRESLARTTRCWHLEVLSSVLATGLTTAQVNPGVVQPTVDLDQQAMLTLVDALDCRRGGGGGQFKCFGTFNKIIKIIKIKIQKYQIPLFKTLPLVVLRCERDSVDRDSLFQVWGHSRFIDRSLWRNVPGYFWGRGCSVYACLQGPAVKCLWFRVSGPWSPGLVQLFLMRI